MPTFVYTGDGSKTFFQFPGEGGAITTRIDGVYVEAASVSTNAARFWTAPPKGSVVEVIQRPNSEAGAKGWGRPLTIEEAPMATTNGAKTRFTPVVRYWSPEADAVPFVVDMLAKKIDVMGNGVRHVSY